MSGWLGLDFEILTDGQLRELRAAVTEELMARFRAQLKDHEKRLGAMEKEMGP